MSRFHLPLDFRKVFAGRARVLAATERFHSAAAKDAPKLAKAIGQVLECAGADSPNGTSLEAFLAEMAGDVRELKNTKAVHHNRESIVAALQMAEEALRAPSCGTCQEKHGDVCNGTDGDDVMLGGPPVGPCIRSLVEAFRLADSEAWAYYQAFHPTPKQLPRPVVHFLTANSGTPNTFGVCPAVGGLVRFADTAGGRVSTVQLLVNVAALDFASLSAVPYALLHECVCHAYADLLPGARRIPNHGDRFAEGWMDWVAGEIAGQLARGVSLAGNRALTYEEHRHGSALHFARTALGAGTAAGRSEGAAQAGHLCHLLRARLGPEPGWRALLRLSFDWNSNPEYYWPRQQFVTVVRELLGRNPDELFKRVQQYLAGAPLKTAFPEAFR